MNSRILDTLKVIAKSLNETNAIWGIGASLMLHYYGLYDNPNDIDIYVKNEDVNTVMEVLNTIAEPIKTKSSNTYTSDYFYKYKLNDIDIDVIAGFTISNDNSSYKYDFNENHIGETADLDGVKIPFCKLEDWIVLYKKMPNGNKKAELIEQYLFSKL